MEVPGPLHYAIFEREWFNKHRYFMGIDKNHEISTDEATDDFIKNKCYEGFSLEEKCRMSYANRFIIPVLLKGRAPEKNLCWIHSRLEDFFSLLSEHNLLREEKIAA